LKGPHWVALFLFLGVLALGLSFRWQGAPVIGNDSYQYMDAASHIAAGKCVCAEVAHFDEQIAAGRMPIPFTHFPPGYPMLVAAVSLAGVSMETAGYLISAAGFLLTIWLIWDLALVLGAKPVAVAALCLLWIVHADVLLFAAAVGTESIFTATFIGIAVLMAREMREEGRHPVLLLSLGATAGVAYWLRYAGLFVVPVAALYIVWRAWRSPRTRVYAGAALLIEGTLVAALQVRNIVLSGSWKGGFNSGGTHGLRTVLTEMAKAAYHVVFGDRVVARADVWTAVFAVSLLVACGFWRRGKWSRSYVPAVALWISILVMAYVGGIITAALTSIVAAYGRYLIPVYPVTLAAVAVLFSMPGTRRQLLAVAALVMSVVAVQSRSLAVRPGLPPHLVAASALRQPLQSGSIGQWLLDRLPPSETIVSVNGQAVHYLLKRPVVSINHPEYSSRHWDDAAVHALMKQFSARYLLVFPGESSFDTSAQDSIPFLHDLVSGSVPDWLKPAASTPNATVFECGDCRHDH
jgi:hypothetical protein